MVWFSAAVGSRSHFSPDGTGQAAGQTSVGLTAVRRLSSHVTATTERLRACYCALEQQYESTRRPLHTAPTDLSSESIRLSGSPPAALRSPAAWLLAPGSAFSAGLVGSAGGEETALSAPLCSGFSPREEPSRAAAESVLLAELPRAGLSPGPESLPSGSPSSLPIFWVGTELSSPSPGAGAGWSTSSPAAPRPLFTSIPPLSSLLSPGSCLGSGTACPSLPVSAVSPVPFLSDVA
ncbi:hypothetical protein EYF80_054414 [Liparis tanakae]|uniref:Uncharacterized protein n=1 Tax=Liparis tanakae TaxID=230148 RepID=A0A4Z2F3T1_9TELE|nr:hypothetical protein EYF80_054414 [Liparis tanakae]